MQGTGGGEVIGTTCQICGQPVKEDEMIVLAGKNVCAVCKPLAVQRLKEGIPLRPEARIMSVGEFLTASWRAFRQDWLLICVLAFLVAIPTNLILLAVDPGSDSSVIEFVSLVHLSELVYVLIEVLSFLGIARIVSARLEGRGTSLPEALDHAFKRWRLGIWTEFLGATIIHFFLLMLVVPGVIWFGYYIFSPIVVSLRNRSGKRALDDSKMLVKGRWWAVMGRVFLVVISLMLVPVGLVEWLFSVEPESQALTLAKGIIEDTLCAAFPVAMTVLFLDLESVGPRHPKCAR